jgi:hypothetical protein
VAAGREVLAEALSELRISHVMASPSALAGATPESCPTGVPHVVARLGGELVAAWSPGRRMFNGYGPTEATIGTTISKQLSAGTHR